MYVFVIYTCIAIIVRVPKQRCAYVSVSKRNNVNPLCSSSGVMKENSPRVLMVPSIQLEQRQPLTLSLAIYNPPM
jgi:hypothetical protein